MTTDWDKYFEGIRNLETENDKLKAENKRLREYARHKKSCCIGYRIPLAKATEVCTCGFEQALKGDQ